MKPVTPQRIDEALKRVEAAAPIAADAAEPIADGDSLNARDVIAVHDLRARGMRLVARNSILYVKRLRRLRPGVRRQRALSPALLADGRRATLSPGRGSSACIVSTS